MVKINRLNMLEINFDQQIKKLQDLNETYKKFLETVNNECKNVFRELAEIFLKAGLLTFNNIGFRELKNTLVDIAKAVFFSAMKAKTIPVLYRDYSRVEKNLMIVKRLENLFEIVKSPRYKYGESLSNILISDSPIKIKEDENKILFFRDEGSYFDFSEALNRDLLDREKFKRFFDILKFLAEIKEDYKEIEDLLFRSDSSWTISYDMIYLKVKDNYISDRFWIILSHLDYEDRVGTPKNYYNEWKDLNNLEILDRNVFLDFGNLRVEFQIKDGQLVPGKKKLIGHEILGFEDSVIPNLITFLIPNLITFLSKFSQELNVYVESIRKAKEMMRKAKEFIDINKAEINQFNGLKILISYES